MSKENFNKNNIEWMKELNKNENPYLLYAPFSNSYWSSYPKIVFCNLEACSSGEKATEENGWPKILDWETFRDHWIDLRGENNREDCDNFTIWNYMIFAYILNERLTGISRQCIEKRFNSHEYSRSKEFFEKLYMKYEIEKVMEKILYMNLQKWINEEKSCRFDENRKNKLNAFINDPIHRKHTLASIEESEPDIFIITGKEGVNALNMLMEKLDLELINKNDMETGMKEYGNTLYVVSYHPSEYNKKYFTPEKILDRVDEIVKKFRKMRKRED
jgi:hypothetical protein